MRHGRWGRKTSWQVNVLRPNRLAYFLTSPPLASPRRPLTVPYSKPVKGQRSKPRWHLLVFNRNMRSGHDRSAEVTRGNVVAQVILWINTRHLEVAMINIIRKHFQVTFFWVYFSSSTTMQVNVTQCILHAVESDVMPDQAPGVFMLECHPVESLSMGADTRLTLWQDSTLKIYFLYRCIFL